MDAARKAGVARFRAVMLTSLTTFAGLTPLILEKATQAQFLIPMAVSLGFGILFATVITLVLVPINYLVLEDLRTDGADGLNCWDLNANGVADPEEDVNNDGVVDVLRLPVAATEHRVTPPRSTRPISPNVPMRDRAPAWSATARSPTRS
jgi:hypothetical protein